MQITNKRIIITGGTSGIGRALVEALHEANEVMVVSRDVDKLDHLKQDFNISAIAADLSSIENTVEAAKMIAKRYDNIDILINNAALQHTPIFIDPAFQASRIAPEINLNLTAPCLLIAYLLPALMRSKGATILNINSGLGLVPKTTSAVYCATKAGLNVLSQSLRYQLEGTNISVRQAFMPLVDTGMTAGRGNGKLSAVQAANLIIKGLHTNKPDIMIGKVKLLVWIKRFAPSIAAQIMKRA